MATDTLWMRCKIENSGFSSERRFEAELPTGSRAVGTAYIEYLKDAQGQPLGSQRPPHGQSMEGRVLCRVLRKVSNNVVIEFPSNDVFRVPERDLEAVAVS